MKTQYYTASSLDRTLQPFAGADIRFARGDVRPVHAEMREAAGGKNVWLVGPGFAELFYEVPPRDGKSRS